MPPSSDPKELTLTPEAALSLLIRRTKAWRQALPEESSSGWRADRESAKSTLALEIAKNLNGTEPDLVINLVTEG